MSACVSSAQRHARTPVSSAVPPVRTTPPYSSFLMSTSHLAIVSSTMPASDSVDFLTVAPVGRAACVIIQLCGVQIASCHSISIVLQQRGAVVSGGFGWLHAV